MRLTQHVPSAQAAKRARPGSLALLASWSAATVVLAVLLAGAREFEQPSAGNAAVSTALLLVTTWALWRWLGPVPLGTVSAAPQTRRHEYTLVLVVAVAVLGLAGFTGVGALVLLGALAAGVLLRVRERPDSGRVAVALALGGLAALAGVADAAVRADAGGILFGALQLPLVVVTLLAGWALARRAGWPPTSIGPVAALTDGPGAAIRSAAFGLLLALPWALGNVVNGAPASDDMRTAWQPIAAAVQPGVAEEAWARVFLVAALYVLFARVASARTALVTAVLVGASWFAFLHAPTNPLSTLAVGTLYAIPLSLLWLRRGLEVAIGFHVCLDLVRYVVAYLTAQGVWFL